MRRPNVALIVVDSLREDHSRGLDQLLDVGFVRYENAIAPAPWTLPSHVSMFTGLYPGTHGVHEMYQEVPGLDEVARDGMRRLNYGVAGELMDEGYEMYFVTANLFITPQYGFQRYTRHLTASPYMPEALDWDEFSGLNESFWRNGRNYLRTAREFLSMGKGALLGRAILRGMKLSMGLGLRDKGSSAVLDAVKEMDAHEPYMLFVNLMEAHEPYTPRDLAGSVSAEAAFNAIFTGRVPEDVAAAWRRQYPRHAEYAVERALDLVRALGRRLEDSLVIVTSDHGQLLGDGGIGHGYFLSDGLLRVPLYVKWPAGMRAARQTGRYVSLAQIPSMMRAAMGDQPAGIGSDVVMAESFGPISMPTGWRSRLPRSALREAFSHRVRIYARGGAATYNAGADRVEGAVGMDVVYASRIARELLEMGTAEELPARA
ncbi:MAG: sulfatase-like hydrolase/transferase [Conexivisphaera sp.]